MGNSECCEEETKGGEFKGGNSLFQPNKISLQSNNPNIQSTHHHRPNKKTTQNPSSSILQRSPTPKITKTNSEEDLPIIHDTTLKSKRKDPQMSQQKEVANNKENENKSGQQHLKQNLFPSQQQEPTQSRPHVQQPDSHLNNKPKLTQEKRLLNVAFTQLNEPVRATLQSKRFFQEKFNFSHFRRQLKSAFYEGQLDEYGKLPNGLGKLYKVDESYYIGDFVNGKAHGEGAFIFPDGSYYFGPFVDDYAEGKGGIYHSSQLNYEGEFQRSCFHGKGSQSGQKHRFVGEYDNNIKIEGVLSWNQGERSYEYHGTFLNSLFNGRGTLKGPTGTYNGQFVAGKKHGQGEYVFSNGLKYLGQYREGVRTGKGALYNPGDKIAYQGDFQNGLPHGKGIVLDKNGRKGLTEWEEGIDKEFL